MLAIVLGGAARSDAESPLAHGIRLEVERGPGAESCADEQAIRAGVVMQLGHDPFTTPVERVVVASTHKTAQGYSATVSLRRVDGTPLGVQRLDYEIATCDELSAAIELAIAVAIDPVQAQQGPAEDRGIVRTQSIPTTIVVVPEAVVGVVTTAETAAAAEPKAASSKESPLQWRFLLGGGVAIGSAPTVVPTLSAGLEAQLADVSVGLQFRADFAGHQAADGGSISTSLLLGELSLCYRWGWLGACGLLEAGARRSTGLGLDPPQPPDTRPYFALGPGLELDVPLVPQWFWIRPEVDVLFPTTSVTLTVASVTVWNSPPISAVLGVTFVLAFR